MCDCWPDYEYFRQLFLRTFMREPEFCPSCGRRLPEPPKPLTERERLGKRLEELQRQRAQLEEELTRRKRNLTELNMQAARHGMDVPLSISNGQDFEKEEIARVKAELYNNHLATLEVNVQLKRLEKKDK